MRRKKSLYKQKGILTIDFIFSFAMVIGLFQIFYVLAFTLMVAHVTQYATFAASRVFYAGDIDEATQRTQAENKFNDLTQNSAVASFYREQFRVSGFEAREFTEYTAPESWRQKYTGAQVTFQSNVLDFNVPFLGRTNTELEGNAFQATISSYMYREPTDQECFQFMQERAAAILQLDPKFNQATSNGFDPSAVGIFADNGC